MRFKPVSLILLAVLFGPSCTRLKHRRINRHISRGIALFKEHKLDEAMAEYREALRLDPTSAEAHYNLGRALFAKLDSKGAMAEYREVCGVATAVRLARTALASTGYPHFGRHSPR